jgi:hypothetical protein
MGTTKLQRIAWILTLLEPPPTEPQYRHHLRSAHWASSGVTIVEHEHVEGEFSQLQFSHIYYFHFFFLNFLYRFEQNFYRPKSSILFVPKSIELDWSFDCIWSINKIIQSLLSLIHQMFDRLEKCIRIDRTNTLWSIGLMYYDWSNVWSILRFYHNWSD